MDSHSRVVQLRADGKTLLELVHPAFGVAGVRTKHRRGDGITPVGQFKIISVNRGSKFRKFIGINFPTREYAVQALNEKVITESQFTAIMRDIKADKLPPQDTPLGGLLGIHGLGSSSLKIHRVVNWTDGCVALDNGQIDQLVEVVEPGMTVVIR